MTSPRQPREPSARLRAKDLMTTQVLTAAPETNVKDLAVMMLRHRISGIPILRADGRLVGIVTEGDLLYKELLPGPEGRPDLAQREPLPPVAAAAERARKAEGLVADTVMTTPVITVTEEATLHEIAALMVKHRINRVPVTREDHIVGIVSRADVLKAFTRPDAAISAAVWESLSHDVPVDLSGVLLEVQNGVVYLYGAVATASDKALVEHWTVMVDGVVGVQSWLTAHSENRRVPA